jgi:glycosyltransferase involved in cell wall biosynthesis
MISFIMPAKNVSLYVREAIEGLTKASYKDWELIAIDDHSSDDTLAVLKDAEKRDSRIKVSENKGCGKVIALNYGYSLTSGEIIKCIDADDVLAATFFDCLEGFADYDVSCHNYYITKGNLKIIAEYSPRKAFFNESFNYCVKNLVSLPRCVWSFKRHIGNMIFPMPEDLPFEDVWFSLIIKKYAGSNIKRVDKPLYYYRQHDNQVYGGILNFDKEVITFRAKRMLKLIEVIKHEQTKRLISGIKDKDFFKDIGSFYRLLAEEKLKLWYIITSGIPFKLKLKLLVYKKLTLLAPLIVRSKWQLDKIR